MLRDLILPEVMCFQSFTSYLVSYMISQTTSHPTSYTIYRVHIVCNVVYDVGYDIVCDIFFVFKNILFFCGKFNLSTLLLKRLNQDNLCIENRLPMTQAKSWSRYMLPPWNGICSPERLKWRQTSCESCKTSRCLSGSSSFWRPTYRSKVERNKPGNSSKHTVYCTRCASSFRLVGQRISAPKVLSTVTLISAKRW